MKGKLPGCHIINETSKRVGLRPQKETTPENLAFHRFKQKTQMKLKAKPVHDCKMKNDSWTLFWCLYLERNKKRTDINN